MARAAVPGAEIIEADALAFDWSGIEADVVLGNPPFWRVQQWGGGRTMGIASGTNIGQARLSNGLEVKATFAKGFVTSVFIDGGELPIDNAALAFAAGGLGAASMNPSINLRLRSLGTAVVPVSNPAANPNPNPAGTKLSIIASSGAFSGSFTLVDPAGKRPVKFNGLIIPDPSTHTTVGQRLDGLGAGFFLLNQLPNTNVLPVPKLTTTPILSGQVILEKVD
jgi:hypothetical protein